MAVCLQDLLMIIRHVRIACVLKMALKEFPGFFRILGKPSRDHLARQKKFAFKYICALSVPAFAPDQQSVGFVTALFPSGRI